MANLCDHRGQSQCYGCHVMILEDQRISARVIAETLGISRERVGHIIHNSLDMRKGFPQTMAQTRPATFHFDCFNVQVLFFLNRNRQL
uniref:Uncharacterized protein n=1 Tax=Octopus bimaculoides TaxID=37653 RepID=A0A0L8H715_OCTBM